MVCTLAVNGLGPVTLQKTPLREPQPGPGFPSCSCCPTCGDGDSDSFLLLLSLEPEPPSSVGGSPGPLGPGGFWAERDRIYTLTLPREEARRGAMVRGQRLRGVKPSPLKVTCQAPRQVSHKLHPESWLSGAPESHGGQPFTKDILPPGTEGQYLGFSL